MSQCRVVSAYLWKVELPWKVQRHALFTLISQVAETTWAFNLIPHQMEEVVESITPQLYTQHTGLPFMVQTHTSLTLRFGMLMM